MADGGAYKQLISAPKILARSEDATHTRILLPLPYGLL